MKANQNHIQLSYVVPVYLENKNCDALTRIIEIYENYDSEILKKIHFIFVDDCSPISFKISSKKLNFTLARIDDEIKWNQGGARNLGVNLANSSKIILTDLDHLFSENLLKILLKRPTPNSIYKFNRIKNGKKINSHPNTMFCTKSIFYKSLGVDEEFCGNYGYEDIFFLLMQKKLGTKFKKIRRYPVEVIDHLEETIESHHFLQRDTKANLELLNSKKELIAQNKIFEAHSRLHLNFNWKILGQSE